MKNFMLALFLLCSVVAAEEPKTLEVELGKLFVLSVLNVPNAFSVANNIQTFRSLLSDTATFEDLELSIQEIQDSRCPTPDPQSSTVAACVWEGEVKVTVNVEGGESVELTTPPITAKDYAIIRGYKLTLLEVEPYPSETASVEWPKTVSLLLEKTP